MEIDTDKEDIKLLITIDKEIYNDIKNRTISFPDIPLETFNAIANSMPIPKWQKWIQVGEEQSVHVNFDSSETSKIIYKPHCEKCGAVIDQDIQYKRINREHNRIWYTDVYEFDTCRCKVCGSLFDSAEIRLPEEVKEF